MAPPSGPAPGKVSSSCGDPDVGPGAPPWALAFDCRDNSVGSNNLLSNQDEVSVTTACGRFDLVRCLGSQHEQKRGDQWEQAKVRC